MHDPLRRPVEGSWLRKYQHSAGFQLGTVFPLQCTITSQVGLYLQAILSFGRPPE